MQPLDIVRTPKGGIAIISETNDGGTSASIRWLGPPTDERSAWWRMGELEVVNSLPRVLAMMTAHPFGKGKRDVAQFFPNVGSREPIDVTPDAEERRQLS